MKKSFLLYTIFLILVSIVGFSGELPKIAKDKTIIVAGKISDVGNNEFLAGVKISCPNCQKTIYSDLDGKFFIYLEVKADENLTLEFSQIGYASKTLNLLDIQSNPSNLNIDLQPE
jgi:hypothetical protein